MKQTDPQYKLRLPQELKDQVEEAAKQSGRSMNAEIVARLESSFLRENGNSSQPIGVSAEFRAVIATELAIQSLKDRFSNLAFEIDNRNAAYDYDLIYLSSLEGDNSPSALKEIAREKIRLKKEDSQIEKLKQNMARLYQEMEKLGVWLDLEADENDGIFVVTLKEHPPEGWPPARYTPTAVIRNSIARSRAKK